MVDADAGMFYRSNLAGRGWSIMYADRHRPGSVHTGAGTSLMTSARTRGSTTRPTRTR
jgi:hypothetical protein